MTETEFPPILLSLNDSGRTLTFRGDTPEQITELLNGFLKTADETFEGLSNIQQLLTATSVLTNTPPPSGGSKAVSSPRSVAPPSGDAPTCDHGVMKDIGGPPGNRNLNKKNQPYRAQYYCPAPWGATDKCDAVDV